MNEKSKTIIKGEIFNLPKEAQEVINNSNWEKISEEIGRKYLLDDNEIETLQLETASLLLGLIDEDIYKIEIEDEVGASKNEAEKISEEIFQKILVPIDNAITEKIKNNMADKKPNAEQTLNFILSGGDYGAFMENRNIEMRPETTNVPIKPKNMTDIKSKLVI